MLSWFVNGMGMRHAEDRRSAFFLEQISKILMFESFFCCDSLSWIISQQLVQQIDELLWPIRHQFLKANSSFLWEIEIVRTHMRSPTFEQLNQRWFRSSKDLINLVNLIKFALTIKERILSDHLEKHTAVSPDIHLGIIVAIGHQAFRSSVPTCRDVFCIGLLRVDTWIW